MALVIGMGITSHNLAVGQRLPRRPTSVSDRFNIEAAAFDTAGIRKYSEDLVHSVAPDNLPREKEEQLINRLFDAEKAARSGKGKLVREADVARAFNELMVGVGATPPLSVDEASIHRFREHAAANKDFPALLSAGRDGTNCNPGEAVFLIYLLMLRDGKLSVLDPYYEQSMASGKFQQDAHGGAASGGLVSMGASSSTLLSSYSSDHSQKETTLLLERLASALGF